MLPQRGPITDRDLCDVVIKLITRYSLARDVQASIDRKSNRLPSCEASHRKRLSRRSTITFQISSPLRVEEGSKSRQSPRTCIRRSLDTRPKPCIVGVSCAGRPCGQLRHNQTKWINGASAFLLQHFDP